eukprot:scaffold922_cov327-Pinguiococcus_pyrenoidosus.AAC.42
MRTDESRILLLNSGLSVQVYRTRRSSTKRRVGRIDGDDDDCCGGFPTLQAQTLGRVGTWRGGGGGGGGGAVQAAEASGGIRRVCDRRRAPSSAAEGAGRPAKAEARAHARGGHRRLQRATAESAGGVGGAEAAGGRGGAAELSAGHARDSPGEERDARRGCCESDGAGKRGGPTAPRGQPSGHERAPESPGDCQGGEVHGSAQDELATAALLPGLTGGRGGADAEEVAHPCGGGSRPAAHQNLPRDEAAGSDSRSSGGAGHQEAHPHPGPGSAGGVLGARYDRHRLHRKRQDHHLQPAPDHARAGGGGEAALGADGRSRGRDSVPVPRACEADPRGGGDLLQGAVRSGAPAAPHASGGGRRIEAGPDHGGAAGRGALYRGHAGPSEGPAECAEDQLGRVQVPRPRRGRPDA